MHRPETAFVVRHVGTNCRLDGETGVSMRVVEHYVNAAGALRRRAGEVDEDLVSLHLHLAANHNRFFETITPGFVAPFAAWQFSDFRAHCSFGTADDLVGDRVDAVELKFFHHFKKRTATGIVACGLGVEITDDFVRLSYIDTNNLHQYPIGLAPIKQLHDRNSQPLFENLACFSGKYPPADIGAMTSIRKQRDQPILLKHRRGNRDVVDLTSGLPWIIGNQNVAPG